MQDAIAVENLQGERRLPPPPPLTILSVVTIESFGCHAYISSIHVEVYFFPLALTPEEIDLKFPPLF